MNIETGEIMHPGQEGFEEALKKGALIPVEDLQKAQLEELTKRLEQSKPDTSKVGIDIPDNWDRKTRRRFKTAMDKARKKRLVFGSEAHTNFLASRGFTFKNGVTPVDEVES